MRGMIEQLDRHWFPTKGSVPQEYWYRLPREVVETQLLGTFKKYADVEVRDMV